MHSLFFIEKSDPEKRTSMVRDSIENVNDGAEEKMLGSGPEGDNEKLAQKELEVKFIQGADVNGDAQIDIGDVKQVSDFFFKNFTVKNLKMFDR